MARTSTRTPMGKFFADSVKHAKYRAKNRYLCEFDNCITPDFLMGLYTAQNGKCVLSGMEMELTRGGDWNGGKNPMVCSIDRKDPTGGYTIDNVQLACAKWNVIKESMSNKEWFAMCEAGASMALLQRLM